MTGKNRPATEFYMESAWFDQSGYLELASRMTREVETITSGIGQKTG